MNSIIVFAAAAVAVVCFGSGFIAAHLIELQRRPAHGDHEPSWVVTGVSHTSPSGHFKARGCSDELIEIAMRGTTTISQVCVANTASGTKCGRVQAERHIGYVSVPGWAEQR